MARNERLIEKVKLLKDVREAIRQIERGEGVPNRTAKAELKKRFMR